MINLHKGDAKSPTPSPKILSVHNPKPMKDYGNGILASSDALAAIGQQYLEELKAEQRRREWFAKWNETRPEGTYGTWNISDRH